MWGVVWGNWIVYACVHTLAQCLPSATRQHIYIAVWLQPVEILQFWGPKAGRFTLLLFCNNFCGKSLLQKKNRTQSPDENVITEWIKLNVAPASVGVLLFLISYHAARMFFFFFLLSDKHTSQWAASSGGMNVDLKVMGWVSNVQYIYSCCLILQTSIQAKTHRSLWLESRCICFITNSIHTYDHSGQNQLISRSSTERCSNLHKLCFLDIIIMLLNLVSSVWNI